MTQIEFSVGFPIIVTLRVLAVIVSVDLYLQHKERRHLILALAWAMYSLSGLLRVPPLLHPQLGTLPAAMLAAVAVVFIILIALSYVRPAVMLRLPHVGAAVGVLVALGVPLNSVFPELGFFAAVQAGTMLGAALYLGWRWKIACRRLERAAYALMITLLLGTVQAALMTISAFPFDLAMVSTPALNTALLLFFISAENHRAAESARESAQRLAQAERFTGIGYWERDLRTGEAAWSDGHYRIFNVDRAQGPLQPDEIDARIHPDDVEKVRAGFLRVASGSEYLSIEFRLLTPNEATRWIKGAIMRRPGDDHIFGLIQDMTEQKRAARKFETALTEKTVLIRELHHRIKNNLQVILSIIRLRLDGFSDIAVQTAVGDIENRIQGMVQAYEHILAQDDISAIPMSEFVRRVTDDAFAVYQSPIDPPEVQYDVDEFELPMDLALPVGMVLGELVVNACTHAFIEIGDPTGAANGGVAAGTEAPRIRITVRRSNALVHITVHDNGRGYPSGIFASGTAGAVSVDLLPVDVSGRRLGFVGAASFVQQLRGQLILRNAGGAHAELSFPAAKPEEEADPLSSV